MNMTTPILRQVDTSGTGRALIPGHHQLSLCEDIAAILQRANHAYLEAPTGTGKTLAIALTGEMIAPARAIYLTHSRDIQRQATGELARFEREGLVNPDRWQVMTWQRFRSAAQRGVLRELVGTDSPELVFVDECHFGGTARGITLKSFAAIKAAAQKVVWVSATPWNLDEATLGARSGHTAALSMDDAYRQKLLNPVELLRVDCGLHIRAAVANLELRSGKAFSTLASRLLEINEADAQQTYQELSAEIRAMTGRTLTMADVAPIVRHRYRLMADLYIARHRSERAMFWLPNKLFARECAAYITKRLPSGQSAKAIIDTEGLAYEVEESRAAIAAFEDPTSEVRVACVVYRLREGFDSPELRLGFDCSWSPQKVRIAVQKMGRLTRISADKPTSQFYYAVDVKTVAGVSARQLAPEYLNKVRETFETNGAATQFMAEALLEARTLTAAAAGSVVHILARAISETLYTENAAVHAVRMPLLAFDRVDQFRVIDSAILSAASQASEGRHTTEQGIELVLKSYEAGEQPDQNRRPHRELVKRCRQDSPLYVPSYVARMQAAAPAMLQKWEELARRVIIDKHTRQVRVTALVERILAGEPRPPGNTTDGKLLGRVLTLNGPLSEPALIKKMEAAGLWMPRDKRLTEFKAATKANIERIVGEIERGGNPPPQGTVDRRRLSGWLSPCGSKTRPDVRTRIAACRPDLLPKGVTYGERDRRRAKIIQDILNYARETGALPTKKHPLGPYVRAILHQQMSGSDAAIKELGTILPAWTHYNRLLETLARKGAHPAHAVKRALASNPSIARVLVKTVLNGESLKGLVSLSDESREARDYVLSHRDEWKRVPHLVRKLSNYLDDSSVVSGTNTAYRSLLFGRDSTISVRIERRQSHSIHPATPAQYVVHPQISAS
jgi:superfamily II DNA or RNA helicase